MKKVLLLLAFLVLEVECKPSQEYQTTVNGSKFNTGSITTIERACVHEDSTAYHNCFVVACDTKLDRILYVSDHHVTITPFKCKERK